MTQRQEPPVKVSRQELRRSGGLPMATRMRASSELGTRAGCGAHYDPRPAPGTICSGKPMRYHMQR